MGQTTITQIVLSWWRPLAALYGVNKSATLTPYSAATKASARLFILTVATFLTHSEGKKATPEPYSLKLPNMTTTNHNVMKTYNNPPIGCYFDGAHGQTYNDIQVIKLAMDYGWNDADAQAIIDCDDNDREPDPEIMADIVQDAEGYLNGLEARSFLSWQWNDGDFGLYPNIEGAKEDCEFVSSRKQDCPDDDYEGEWLHINDHGNVTLYVRQNGQDKEIWSCV
jgi:hypothetical protein